MHSLVTFQVRFPSSFVPATRYIAHQLPFDSTVVLYVDVIGILVCILFPAVATTVNHI